MPLTVHPVEPVFVSRGTQPSQTEPTQNWEIQVNIFDLNFYVILMFFAVGS